jgi:hypothetical protein
LFRICAGSCPSSFLWCGVLQACYSCRPCLFSVCVGNCPSLSLGRASCTSATVASLPHPKLAGGSHQTHLLRKACLFKVCWSAFPSLFLWSAQGALTFLLCVLFSSLFSFGFFSFIHMCTECLGHFSPLQLFFPVGSDCPGGYAGLSQGWL